MDFFRYFKTMNLMFICVNYYCLNKGSNSKFSSFVFVSNSAVSYVGNSHFCFPSTNGNIMLQNIRLMKHLL